VTEVEWLAETDPERMLGPLRGKVSERKLRLFAAACCRRAAFLVDAWAYDFRRDDYWRALATAERFADGASSAAELDQAQSGADDSTFINQDLEFADLGHGVDPFRDVASADPAVVADIRQQILILVREFGADPNETGPRRRHDAEERAERAAQAGLLRDLLGNPFRRVAVSPAWQTPQVVALTQAAYDQRELPSGTLAPARLAVLADALEEAGCAAADLLGHLRGPGPHVRGCWALDLLLGKA
jgi:hypothetical protein